VACAARTGSPEEHAHITIGAVHVRSSRPSEFF
jgi:hypothetical protein